MIKQLTLFIISLLLLCSSSMMAAVGTFDDVKVIYKSAKVYDEFELEISNKHGRIDVENWDKDSVAIEVTISASSNNLDRLSTIMQQVNIRFSEQEDYLAASTEWGGGANELRIDVVKLFDNQSVRVDYKVWIPENTELEIENKFGDVILENCSAKLKVDVAHGDFKAHKLKNAKMIKVQYGDVTIKEIKEGNIVVRFGDVTIDKAKELNVDIISGDAEFESVDELTLKATSSDIEIEEIKQMDFSISMSDLEIEKLSKSVSGFIKFGGMEIEEVGAGFSGITLDAYNTDIALDFVPQIAYNYVVQLEKGKAFSIPSSGNTLTKDNTFDDAHQYEGTFATVPVSGLPPMVNISAKGSFVKLGIK